MVCEEGGEEIADGICEAKIGDAQGVIEFSNGELFK